MDIVRYDVTSYRCHDNHYSVVEGRKRSLVYRRVTNVGYVT